MESRPRILNRTSPHLWVIVCFVLLHGVNAFAESHGATAAAWNTTSGYQCSNCISWCEQSLRQNGSRAAYDSCVLGCSQQIQSCSAPPPREMPEPIFEGNEPPSQSSDNGMPAASASAHSDFQVPQLPEEPQPEANSDIRMWLAEMKQAEQVKQQLKQRKVDLQFEMISAVTDESSTAKRQVIAEELKQTHRDLRQQELRHEQADRNLSAQGYNFRRQ